MDPELVYYPVLPVPLELQELLLQVLGLLLPVSAFLLQVSASLLQVLGL